MDYAVVATVLEQQVKTVRVWLDLPCSPHSPVEVVLAGLRSRPFIRQAVKARAFPARRPMGCDNEPIPLVWSWRTGTQPAELAAGYKQWLLNKEQQLLMINDVPDHEVK